MVRRRRVPADRGQAEVADSGRKGGRVKIGGRRRGDEGPGGDWSCVLVFLTYIAISVAMASWWIWSTATPLGLSAPRDVFSEARALTHVDVLSRRIGHRQVSSPGNRAATRYLREQVEHLAIIANRRGDMEAEIAMEMVSGAVKDHIFNAEAVNAYRFIPIVMLYLSPIGKSSKPALLVNAHYDSTFGSTGASDCASCVGIGLEVARSIIERKAPIQAPLLFMFNGGEETIMQAAHGFVTSSPWRHRVGAFINLESTGSGGLPILFRYSGIWALKAYAKGAKHPRGTVVGQDFFNLNVIPADTDFRMLSMDHHGLYPGVDIATVLDAAPYHTDRDTFERIRRGTIQEYGDSVFGVIQEFSKEMAGSMPDLSPSDSEAVVFFDVFHSFMITYHMSTAVWLHLMPQAALVLILIARAAIGGMSCWKVVQNLVGGIACAALSLLLSMAVPGLVGVLRVLATGKPMIWFAHHIHAVGIFVPAAMAAAVAPWAAFPVCGSGALYHVVGISMVISLCSLYLTNLGLGSSTMLAQGAISGGLMALVFPKIAGKKIWRLIPVLFSSWWWVTSNLAFGGVIVEHVMEKLSIVGAIHPVYGIFIPDMVIGALIGAIVWLCCLFLLPVVAAVTSRRQQWSGIVALLLFSALCAFSSSASLPYSSHRPKRIFMSHIEMQKVPNGDEYEPYFLMVTLDPISIESVIEDSPDLNLNVSGAVPAVHSDSTAFFPFNLISKGLKWHAPPLPAKEVPWGQHHPKIVQTGNVVRANNETRLMSLEIHWAAPGWGALNITGPILSWSFTEELSSVPRGDNGRDHVVRIAQDEDGEVWPFWLEAEDGAEVKIEIGILYHQTTTFAQEVTNALPDWTSVGMGVMCSSEWTF
ncbi:unnamed protein product [Ostreobium quekettii]|uniref:Peptidase M28 domain-containing protein n=1 Tax=Ostreobium quekettii TaxID=121088 RepID=A0A8S1IZW3_9CHLO|nr:unnamed protein product [Ostreobium quekettii]